jgi:hypothetical protein
MLRNTLRILALSSPQKTSIVAVLRMRGMLTEKPFRKWATFFRSGELNVNAAGCT